MHIQITAETQYLRFEWSGGPYIDVFNQKHTVPHDVINVCDYEAGKSRIPFTPEAMQAEIEKWFGEVPEAVRIQEQVDAIEANNRLMAQRALGGR